MDRITSELKKFYADKFQKFGPTSQGVGWKDETHAVIRMNNMLQLLSGTPTSHSTASLLDVGCGYGALLEHSKHQGYSLTYTGIDVAENMIKAASEKYPEGTFLCGDFFQFQPDSQFDFVVCNGILTQKLSASDSEMESFFRKLVKRMFELSRQGVAFNMLTDKVDFRLQDNYYQNPSDTLDFCLKELTSKVKLDHTGHLYEYTTYLYKE